MPSQFVGILGQCSAKDSRRPTHPQGVPNPLEIRSLVWVNVIAATFASTIKHVRWFLRRTA